MSDAPTKKSRFKVILFALLTSVICSVLITASAIGLKDRQQTNMELDRKVNILKAANLVGEKKPGGEKINELYDTHIKEVMVDSQGKIIEAAAGDYLHFYFIRENNTPDARVNGYILPINTRGLWGKIYGYLAFSNDGQTVSGFSVFSHSETPGLGGEIESDWFRRNFEGKRILNAEDRFVSVGIAKGKVENLPEDLQEHYVDGISGATLTGKYLTEGIRQTLERYDAVSITFRQKQLKPQKTDQ